jgi:hypothetical protein
MGLISVTVRIRPSSKGCIPHNNSSLTNEDISERIPEVGRWAVAVLLHGTFPLTAPPSLEYDPHLHRPRW